MTDLEYLDGIAEDLIDDPKSETWGVLSTGEACYVFLAANRPDLGKNMTVAYMFNRIGAEWRQALLDRWATTY